MILNSSVLANSIKSSLLLWKNNLLPTLFPFFLFSNILINYGFIEILSEITKPFMNKLFRLNGNTSFILFMSMISGIPSNAKYTSLLLDKGLISEKDANKIILFTQFNNPLFIIYTIGITFLNSYKLGLIILISHYISNFLIGIIIRDKIYLKEKVNYKAIKNNLLKNNNLGSIISNSIKDSINTMLLILGVISFFMIITSIINLYIKLPLLYTGIVNGIFEITQGIKIISICNISNNLKGFIIVSMISFGGLSSHLQVMSILDKKKIRYKSYLLSRIFHSILSSLIYLLLSYYIAF